MSDEQQHPMEKPLRAWADERRRQAGPPFELHVVDRARLQDEVGQVYATGGAEPPRWVPVWRALLPRLAFIGVFTSLLVLALLRLAPRDEGELQTVAQLRPEESATVIDEGLIDDAPAADSRSPEGRGVAVESGSMRVLRPEPAPVAAQPVEAVAPTRLAPPAGTEKAGSPKLEAPEPIMEADSASRQLLMKRYGTGPEPQSAQVSLAPAPTMSRAAAPQPRPPAIEIGSLAARDTEQAREDGLVAGAVTETATVRSSTEAQPGGETSGSTRAAEPDWQAAFVPNRTMRRNFNAPPAVALQSFQLEQRGRVLRLVDGDGSVYEGTILGEASNLDRAFPQLSLAGGPAPANSQSFEVLGTNRSSQRSLVFQGLLVTGTTDRIQGQALIGGRDRIVIDAVAQ